MAAKRNGGSNGSITVAAHFADFAGFSARFSQPVDSDANYGQTTWEGHHGAGIIACALDAQGFQKYDVASSGPNPDDISADGTACVLTFATGCTITGDFVISDMTLGHARKSGVSPFSLSGMNAGTLAFAWDETP